MMLKKFSFTCKVRTQKKIGKMAKKILLFGAPGNFHNKHPWNIDHKTACGDLARPFPQQSLKVQYGELI
jgi:hypothetical protein